MNMGEDQEFFAFLNVQERKTEDTEEKIADDFPDGITILTKQKNLRY
jgi:hypothetical protein